MALSLRSGEEASTLQYNVPKKKIKDKTTCKKIICPQKLEAQFTSLIGYPYACKDAQNESAGSHYDANSEGRR